MVLIIGVVIVFIGVKLVVQHYTIKAMIEEFNMEERRYNKNGKHLSF